jgi:hypothetical protein
MSSELMRSAVRASKDEYVTRLGDLVLIVNPAFEGARYESLHIAGRRIEGLKHNQLPLLIVATSEADKATGFFFPLARMINTLIELPDGVQYDAAVQAVGHNVRYQTHVLSKCDVSKEPRCLAKCEVFTSSTEKQQPALSKDADTIHVERQMMAELGSSGITEQTTYLCGELELATLGKLQPAYNPYWVVRTTKDIMDGHNDIFNPRFVSFFRQMYMAITAETQKSADTERCVRER